MLAWGVSNSPMIQTYLHLASVDIDRDMGKLYGIELEENEREKQSFKRHVCPSCLHENNPDANYCYVCGTPLTDTAKHDLESAKREIHDDTRYKTLICELEARIKALESMQAVQTP